MREDYIEQLDKMFPDGYIICYTNPNQSLKMTLFNPHQIEMIEDIHKYLKLRSEG